MSANLKDEDFSTLEQTVKHRRRAARISVSLAGLAALRTQLNKLDDAGDMSPRA